jgi:cell fate regulator YaaT (PSP1 superfamily)
MPLVIGVRFHPATKIYFFDAAGFEDMRAGEQVVVETARGEEVGRAIIAPHEVTNADIVSRLRPIVRRATASDLSQLTFYRNKEKETLEKCREKIREHGLPMKLVRAEYSYNGHQLVFFFTSEKRVDFRDLVQDLARTFKARIELRQVGVRDEAKLLGGIGKCGLTLCCSTWLPDFRPVSIKMAKQQDLPLSPMEISGVCGRLLCCLSYEEEHYAETKKRLPRRGEFIDTPRGRAKVIGVNAVKESVQVELETGVVFEHMGSEQAEQPAVVAAPAPAPIPPRPQEKAPGSRRSRKKRKKPSAAPR